MILNKTMEDDGIEIDLMEKESIQVLEGFRRREDQVNIGMT